ncbi:MAG: nucleoside hydrolase [Actinobacteria bacterium]|nr:nucleoside hydrolase [Actinomycetota bacterium]
MRVLFDHDGGVDDFVALALLAASDEVELIGVCCTPGDTYMERSVPTTRALLDLAGLSHVEVAAGTVEGPNEFPDEFRIDGKKVWERTFLSETDESALVAPLVPEPGHEFLARVLLAETEPVAVVATGPLTSIAAMLDHAPEAAAGIARLYWMGGAVDVDGNVSEPGHDGSAEWNAFADPEAAARVWASDVDLWMCPLDATNRVPLTEDLIARFAACADASALSRFAAQAYGSTDQTAYHLWDVLTAAWPIRPDLLFAETVPTELVVDPPSAGRTRRVIGGRAVTAALDCDPGSFHDFLVERLCVWGGSHHRTRPMRGSR